MSNDPRPGLGVRSVINAAGTMTSLGASIARPEVVAAVADVLPQFVEINDLQRQASRVIAEATGAEAGCVTACASAGISIGIAGAMTGNSLARIELLPDTAGLRDEVVIQTGHLCHYSAPVDQAIRITGARVRSIGTINEARPDQLAAALSAQTAAMLFVVSHHTMLFGQIPLEEAAAACRERDVPVIVDAAAEQDLRGFIERGADLVVYSAHKFLGGMTGGIVAGRKDLVRAAYLQSGGIGRGMKVGKEGIVGAMTALKLWHQRDHAAERREQERVLVLWRVAVAEAADVRAAIVPDTTGNPIERLRLDFKPAAASTAATVAAALANGEPPVIVRDEFLDLNMFELDPCNLHPGEAEVVAERLRNVLATPPNALEELGEMKRRALAKRLAWPD